MIDAFMLYGPEACFYETLDLLELPSPTGKKFECQEKDLTLYFQDMNDKLCEQIMAMR